jgi:hypothetical protein
MSTVPEIAERLLSRRTKKWFGTRPFFEPHARVSETEFQVLAEKVRAALPEDLRDFLVVVGYGDIGGQLSFRQAWFAPVESGHLVGGFTFAQDDLGNYYASSPKDGSVVFFNRSAPEYSVLAPSFRHFIEELERRDFKLSEWIGTVACVPYDWEK